MEKTRSMCTPIIAVDLSIFTCRHVLCFIIVPEFLRQTNEMQMIIDFISRFLVSLSQWIEVFSVVLYTIWLVCDHLIAQPCAKIPKIKRRFAYHTIGGISVLIKNVSCKLKVVIRVSGNRTATTTTIIV